MVTLISTGGALGDRRCDAKCYDADTTAGSCVCVCGGVNHGVGLHQADEQTAVMADALIERHGPNVTVDLRLPL